MKKAITLFITLVFLIAAISIVSIIIKKISSLQKGYDFIQTSKIIQNIELFLKKTDMNTTIKLFNKPIFFSSKNGDFNIFIDIKPICSININDYLIKNKINTDIERVLDYLLEKYEIKDPAFFKDLILDTIDSDDTERSPFSEIKLANPKFQDGKIYNFKHFSQILNYYIQKTEDKNIKLIPFKDYFNFRSTQIFKECANKNILALNEKNETNFNIINFENNISSFLIGIDIAYKLQNEHKLKIIYDIKQKKVKDIEENPLY
jgi:hypothetical protein